VTDQLVPIGAALNQFMFYVKFSVDRDRLCGLVVRVSGYRYRGPGFDPRH